MSDGKKDVDLAIRAMNLDPDEYAEPDLDEILLRACYLGQVEVVAAAIKAGADPNLKSDDDRFPLERAALCDRVEAIAFLVDAGAEVDACDKKGMTSLMTAAWFGCWESVRALLDAGANAQAVSSSGQSALHYACRDGLYGEAAQLCARGGWSEKPDGEGTTPLDHAIKQAHPRLATLLASRGTLEGLEETLARWAPWVAAFRAGGAPNLPDMQAQAPHRAHRAMEESVAAVEHIAQARRLAAQLREEIVDPEPRNAPRL